MSHFNEENKQKKKPRMRRTPSQRVNKIPKSSASIRGTGEEVNENSVLSAPSPSATDTDAHFVENAISKKRNWRRSLS